MELHPILQFIADYGYWIAVPLMIIEGPIVTIVMGLLASLGVVSLPVVIVLGVVSDLISDTIYYYSGYHGGPRVLARFRINDLEQSGNLKRLKDKFDRHPGKIFFGAKVLTGLAHSTFVLAGVTKVDYSRILRYTIPGGICWSTALALIGFYFGREAQSISRLLSLIGLTLFGILFFVLFYKFWLGKYLAQRFGFFNADTPDYLSK